MSFGNTIHKTLEEFLKLWKARQEHIQRDLFGKDPQPDKIRPPTFEELCEIYYRVWIDDWYATAAQKQEYREIKGIAQLKNFYEHFIKNLSTPTHIEAPFKIAMGPYKFTGKIDRIDRGAAGLIIIDYKTGATTAKKLEKVDKDQLIIYQLAAQEFLKEKVESGVYWYLDGNMFSDPFLASAEQCEKLRQEYTETISTIVNAIESDNFASAEEGVKTHDCEYRYLAN